MQLRYMVRRPQAATLLSEVVGTGVVKTTKLDGESRGWFCMIVVREGTKSRAVCGRGPRARQEYQKLSAGQR